MYPALIRWFVTVVPMCPLATPMYSILRLMGTDPSSQILVIDDAQKPLGVVSCHELLLGLVYSQPSMYGQSIYEQIVLNPGKLTAVCSVLTGIHPSEQGIEILPKAIAHQSLQACLEAISLPPDALSLSLPQSQQLTQWASLHPIACIPGHRSLYDFQAEFIAKTAPPSYGQSMAQMMELSTLEWVVVDRQGSAVGLLNQEQVWRSLALASSNDSGQEALSAPNSLRALPYSGSDLSSSVSSASTPAREEETPHRSNSDALKHVFIQRLKEAQARIQSLLGQQWDHKLQSQFKNDLMAYLSHEIKTPLTALVGLSELLLKKIEAMDAILLNQPSTQGDNVSVDHGLVTQSTMDPSDPTVPDPLSVQKQLIERQHLYARLMQHSSHQLMSLMTVLFDLIHLETGQLALSLQSVALDSLCQSAYHYAWEDYCRTKQPIEPTPTNPTKPDHEMPQLSPGSLSLHIGAEMAEVIVDEQQFKRLLSCLLANALQLQVSQEPIQIRVERQGEWVALQVSYQGEGIPPAQQSQIFRAVDISDDSANPVFKGVGLRLLLALRLAEAHGGTLTWWSNPGEGVNATVLLPCQTTLCTPQPLSNEPDLPGSHHSRLPFVVIADDEPNRIDPVFKAVSALGYGVAIARSGPEALDKIRCLGAKTILLNPGMVYHPGATLLSILSQDEETQSIPLIAVTPVPATAEPHARERIDAYLQFPVDRTVLQSHLARLIQSDNPVQTYTSSKPITLLYFNPDLGNTSSTSGDVLDLNAILYPHHCRVIEVDSIDQAELLTRVWHPDVIILGMQPSLQGIHPSLPFQKILTALKDCDELANLPMVTLTIEVTEFAYSLDLKVFPCLTPLAPVPSNDNQQVTSFALLQVIQLAAASHSRP